MAYEKQEWNCGDTITADKMNHIEEGIENAQNGYECTESWTTLIEETVTTAYDSEVQANTGTLAYTQLIDADVIRVTFNGAEYECEKRQVGLTNQYGADNSITPLWSDYPFCISSYSVDLTASFLITPSAGTYTVKIELVNLVAEVSDCFKTAVKEASKGNVLMVAGFNDSLDKKWDEINNAILSGTKVIIQDSTPSDDYATETNYEVLNTYRTFETMSEASDPTTEVGVVTSKGTYKASSKSGTLTLAQ